MIQWREELTGPYNLPKIPEEGEFREAWDVIGALQRTISVENLSLAKDAAKVFEGSPKKGNVTSSSKGPEDLKDSKKKVRGFLSVKTAATRALEMKGSPKLKKPDPSIIVKDSKDTFTSSPEQPQKKKPKYTES